MLTQRLQQHGVITDLSQVTGEDVAAMAQRAEQAKQQAQYATVYGRAVKSVLGSLTKVAKAKADLYKTAHEKLKEADKHTLDALKSELRHQVHMTEMETKANSERTIANARQASVQELEQARLHGRLVQLGIKHRQALQAARPQRRKLFGII